jgi:hypothetical protein
MGSWRESTFSRTLIASVLINLPFCATFQGSRFVYVAHGLGARRCPPASVLGTLSESPTEWCPVVQQGNLYHISH